jgi:hypothetical protein
MRSVLSGNSSYERAFQDTFLCSKIPESICCLFVSGERMWKAVKSSCGIKSKHPALPWHISPHAVCTTSSLQPKFLNANAPTLSKHPAIYEETKVVIDVWPGRLVCDDRR